MPGNLQICFKSFFSFRIFNRQNQNVLLLFFMVDPKKEYELLMRYLQGGAIQHGPLNHAEPLYPDDWRPPTAPQSAAAPLLYADNPLTAVPGRSEQATSGAGWLPRLKEKLQTASRPARLLTAVLSLVLLLFFAWKGYRFYQLSPQTMFTELYVPFAVAGTPQPNLNTVENYYAQGNFIAVTLLSKKGGLLTDREKLITGLAYLKRHDYTNSIKWLEPAANNFKSPYRRQAEYYLALTYLINEDYDRCIERMEHIATDPVHPYGHLITEDTIDDVKVLKWK
jgi:hypothetical protein